MLFSRPDRNGSVNLRPAALVRSGDVDLRPAIHPIAVLQAALLLLFVANLGRLSIFSTGEREAPILFNDLCVGVLLCVGAFVAVRRRSLRRSPEGGNTIRRHRDRCSVVRA